MLTCPLCGDDREKSRLTGPDTRGYHRCGSCDLVFVDRADLLPPADERHRYEHHNNGPEYPGYVQFLARAVDPTVPRLTAGMRGLDYGCGPGPTISTMLARHSIRCDDYDPFFRTIDLNPPYDFAFCTECFEHFHEPAQSITHLVSLVRPAGVLTIMTELLDDDTDFSDWFYARDLTHTAFYSRRTFEYIRGRFGLTELFEDDRRVRVYRRE